MTQETNLDELRKMAQQLGLKLSDGELLRLLPGVSRSRKQVSELRELLAQSDEPAGFFVAGDAANR